MTRLNNLQRLYYMLYIQSQQSRRFTLYIIKYTSIHIPLELTQLIPDVRISGIRPGRVQCFADRDRNYATHAKGWLTSRYKGIFMINRQSVILSDLRFFFLTFISKERSRQNCKLFNFCSYYNSV